MGARGHRRLLEDLHARGLRDRAVPQSAVHADRAPARARLPLPLLDLRPRRRRQGAVRPRRTAPATASARHPPGPAPRGGRRRLPSARGGLVGSPQRMKHDPIEDPVRFIDERAHAAPLLRKTLRYLVPDHWSFLLGEVALYTFIALVAPGTFLALFFEPSLSETVYRGSYAPLSGATMSHAYKSAVDLSFDVKAGLLMRQTHHWAADIFVAAIVVHLLRVFFTGAFRKPRELTYLIGLAMLFLGLLEGYLGYSMVDDLLSGMGLAIGYAVALSVPFVGGNLALLLWGAPYPGDPSFESRMFIAHVFLLPALIAVLIGVH